MCHLNDRERTELVQTLDEIRSTFSLVDGHRLSISDTSFVEHETLAPLLRSLGGLADTAHTWVIKKSAGH